MDGISDNLIVGVSVDGGHETLFDLEVFHEGLGDWTKAVSGAGSVGDALGFWFEIFVVNTENEGAFDFISRWNGKNDLLGAGFDVAIITVFVTLALGTEDTGGFENDIDAHFLPWELGWA